jgi:hypothetical protein
VLGSVVTPTDGARDACLGLAYAAFVDDEDRRAISERRARLIRAALSACVVVSCGDESQQAVPKPCLSFGCAEGYERAPGARDLLTARAQQTDPAFCVPKGSISAATVAAPTVSAPAPCLSFGCAEGYERAPGAKPMLTAQADRTDPSYCVPKRKGGVETAPTNGPKK